MPGIIKIDVELCDILTGSVCTKLVVEFIKYVAYQRQQIPYNYQQLESVLKIKPKFDVKDKISKPSSLKAMRIEQEYVKVNEQYQTMQSMFQHLEEEINSEKGSVEEVVLVVGATPFSPRDVYRLQLPPLQFGHLAKNHPPQKALLNLYQSLISSEELHSMMRQPLNPTNIYVLLRKHGDLICDGFLHKQRFSVPLNGDQVVISFIPKPVLSTPVHHFNCPCFGIQIYQDDDDNLIQAHTTEPTQVLSTSSWYQARLTMKGFKDVKIDGISVSNLWQ